MNSTEELTPNMSDHDILIILHTNVGNLAKSVQDLKDGTSLTISDHENRIRSLEQFKWLLTGGLILLQIIEGIFIYFLVK